ncbi:uncharacterized protein BDZ83DRAFT_778172 [Colletotrichum acutatum]|uniref:Ankyrin repeat protein n=1 Tax=Glomerella acutata TaxID=27357 RepID=A0AAD8XF21_GLOAC|nr:uncharacterized protein BDZ83DRAFT_778172 [Colletotrichum acutatum]KAK1724842.1 hypothetical protein BDZ83DRAFT_778172 [Colletotrichum acutatum]
MASTTQDSTIPSSSLASKFQRLNGSRAIARVLRWDTARALAECPLCEQPHEHPISFFPSGDERELQRRSNSPYTFRGLEPAAMWFFVAPCHTAGYTYRLIFPFEKHDAVERLSWEIRTSTSEKNEDSQFEYFITVGFRKSELNALPQPNHLNHRSSPRDHFENISIKDHAFPSGNDGEESRMSSALTRDSLKFKTGANGKGDRWGCVHDYATCPHFNHDLRIEGTLGSSRLSLEVAHDNRTNVQELLRLGADVNAGDTEAVHP